jgi:hypothetical protein
MTNDAKSDACAYLLTGLLQRLELDSPGMLKQMISGARGDRLALPADTSDRDYVEQILTESLKILKRADGLIDPARNP